METACFIDGLNFSIISFQFVGLQPAAEHRGNLPGRSKFIEGNNNCLSLLAIVGILVQFSTLRGYWPNIGLFKASIYSTFTFTGDLPSC